MPRRGKVIAFRRPGVEPTRPADEPTLVELCRCAQAEAMVVKGLLDSEGIPVVLRSRLTHSVHPFTVGAQGEVTVLVPRGELARSVCLVEGSAAPPPPPLQRARRD